MTAIDIDARWRASAERPADATLPPMSLILRCAALLLAVKLTLAITGFSHTLSWIRRAGTLSRRTSVIGAAETGATVQQTAYAVALVAALYPGRALCLEQSLVLYAVLRRDAIDARLCLGAKPHPFLAHCWVEVDGLPVNDFPEHVRHFVPLPELPT